MPEFGADHGAATSISSGRRVSRRDFLKLTGLSGAAVAGLALTSGLPRPVRAQSSPTAGLEPVGDTVEELSALLGHDPEAIYRFVSEHVRYEPYSGLLRGPWATLAGRAGNSVDQAALLTLLLRHAGYETRYALGPIDAAVADAMLAGTAADVDTARVEIVEAIAAAPPGLEDVPVEPVPAEYQAEVEAALEGSEAATNELIDRLSTTTDRLETALADAGVELPTGFSQLPPAELQQHAWVQAEIDGDWVDLDPTMPSPTPGSALVTPTDTLSSLPDDLFHEVRVAVIGETAPGGQPVEALLLDVASRAYELPGQPIGLFNAPADGAFAAGALANAVGLDSYAPTLAIGERAFSGRPMRFRKPEGADDDGGGGAAGALGALGGLGGGGEEEADAGLGGGFLDSGEMEDETTAAWVELTLSGPDQEPQIIRRALFDRFGLPARERGDFSREALEPTSWVDIDGEGGTEVGQAQVTMWMDVSAGLPSRHAPVMQAAQDDPLVGAAMAHGAHVLTELAALDLAIPAGVRPFIDRPNVNALFSRPVADAANDPTLNVSLDILHRSHGVLPVDGVDAAVAPAMLPGVMAHIAEHAITEAASSTPEGSPLSLIRLLELADEQGIALTVLRDPDAVAGLAYPEEAAIRLAARLGEGLVAVAPASAVTVDGEERAGWWLVDVVSGRVVDELDTGGGQTTEDITLRMVGETLLQKIVRCFGTILFAAFMTAVAVALWYIQYKLLRLGHGPGTTPGFYTFIFRSLASKFAFDWIKFARACMFG